MDPILNAIERAKSDAARAGDRPPAMRPIAERPVSMRAPGLAAVREPKPLQTIQLDRARLENNRIVAHDPGDPRSRPYDILRTQVLQQMDRNGWQFLAITSPRPGCGKTLTALNLAFSISRQPERSVFLVDLDLHKPQLLETLGSKSKQGVVGILDGTQTLADSVIEARVGSTAVTLLPAETRVVDPSELIAARTMRTLLQDIKKDYPSHIVIIDMPPMLATDDVLALLPQIDCVLLVAAVGNSTVSDVKECTKHLHSTPLVKMVLNKSIERMQQYDYY